MKYNKKCLAYKAHFKLQFAESSKYTTVFDKANKSKPIFKKPWEILHKLLTNEDETIYNHNWVRNFNELC